MPAVRFIIRPDASVRAQTVAAGEANLAYNIGTELANQLGKSVQGGGFQSSGIRLNNSIEPTKNLNLRMAMNLAIDRKGIIDSIFDGKATPLAFFGFQPIHLDPFPYDPEQATKLIKDGGWNGSELEFVYGENRIPEEPELAEVYKASWEAVGLKIKLNRKEPNQYNDTAALPFEQQPPIVMETTSSGNSGEIAGGLRDKYGCDGTGTFCDPAYDQKYNDLAALTGDKRVAMIQSIAEELKAKAPRVWVAGVVQVHGITSNVETKLPTNTYVFMDDIRFT
jgi:peptide/nickel transport system substrate-binding protein